MVVINILIAAELIIAPVKVGGYEIEALQNLEEQIEDLRDINPDLRIKALMTMRQKNKTSLEVEEWLKAESGFDMFVTPIRRSIIAEKSTTAMIPLPKFSKRGIVSQDYRCVVHQGKATGEGRINRGKGSDEGSGTRSSLMWETIHIIENMGEWRPRYVIWENVKNVKSKYMRPNFDRYMVEMERLGYTNNFEVLDAREFGLPQARERVFTVSVLNGERFEFDDLIRTPMRNLQEFLEDDASVPDVYDVTQPSVLACIGEKGIRRATVITDCAYTITTRQDRTPAQVIDRDGGRYRYLTERECWRLMGYTDEDFDRAKAVQERNGKYYKALYDQAGNSIAVPIFESIFRKIILHEVA